MSNPFARFTSRTAPATLAAVPDAVPALSPASTPTAAPASAPSASAASAPVQSSALDVDCSGPVHDLSRTPEASEATTSVAATPSIAERAAARNERGEIRGLPSQEVLESFVDATIALRNPHLGAAESAAATAVIRRVAETIINLYGGNAELLASNPQLAAAMGVYAESAIRARSAMDDGVNVQGAVGALVAAEEGLAEVAIGLAVGDGAAVAPSAEVRTDPTVLKISVVTGHSDRRFAQIMTGVTGTMGASGFKIDPMYARIAYLFSLMGDGGAVNEAGFGQAQSGTQVMQIDVADESQLRALQVQLLEQSAKAWDDLYAGHLQAMAQHDVSRRMLETERRNTARNVAALRAESALREFFVPVKLSAVVPQIGEATARYADRDALLGAARVVPLTICGDNEREVLEVAPQVDAEVDPAITAHDGPIQLEMSSWIKVLGHSAAEARAVFSNLISLRPVMPEAMDVARLQHGAIDRAELDPRETYSDFDDDFDDDDGDYPALRG